MTPATARSWLRATGSPQQDEPGRPATQRIGNRPDLRALIAAHVKGHTGVDKPLIKETKAEAKDLKDVKIEKTEIKERKEKIEVKEIKVEVKEHKNEKIEIKERKEKIEAIEGKQIIVDQHKHVLEGGGKGLVEGHGGLGGGVINPGPSVGGPGFEPSVDARLSAVEQSVAALAHFIGSDLRPDLGSGPSAGRRTCRVRPTRPSRARTSRTRRTLPKPEGAARPVTTRRPGEPKPVEYAVLCGPEDRSALWAAQALQDRGLPVRVVTTQEVVYSTSLRHTVAFGEVTTAVRLADGTLLGPDLRGTLNRMTWVPTEHLAGAEPADRDYAQQEIHAVLTSVVHGLPGVVLGRADGRGLCGRPGIRPSG